MLKNYKSYEIGDYVSFGRNKVTDNGIALFWAGSGIEFRVAAKKLFVTIDCMYDSMELMLDIIIEGERTQKFTLKKGTEVYQVFDGMNPDKPVKVRLVRDTQNMPDEKNSYLFIKSFETDGEFKEAPEYNYNIEFIGDSLTSGEGCGLTRRDEWIPVVFDAVKNYTYMTADILNANYYVLSQSGWGLYASWDANVKNVLPDYYEQICGTTNCNKCIESGAHDKWDFSDVEMDAVVINLGTNDGTALNTGKFNREEFYRSFKRKAVDFLTTIRKNNPSCVIVWAYGMLGYDMEPLIKEAIDEYRAKSSDSRVEYLKLPEAKQDELGVRWHPTPEAHAKSARVLADYIQSLLAFMLR